METSAALQAFAALANPHRLAVYRALVQAGEAGLTPGTLATQLQLANATLSFHLKALAAAGLLLASPRGRRIHYRADLPRMNALVGFLTENCCGGKPCPDPTTSCSSAPATPRAR